MRIIRILRDRLRALFGRDIVAGEIHEEIQFHLDERIGEHERRGLSRGAARQAALRKFGNPAVVEDLGYDVRGGGLMESFMQDVRYGVRLLWKQRGFSAVALATLALGIGATTAIFCVADAALIRPLPYDNPEQLVRVSHLTLARPEGGTAPSLNDMDEWRAMSHVFSHMGTSKQETAIVIDGSDPERVTVPRVTVDFLPMYGMRPFIGRAFTADDERLEAAPVAILGYRYWQSKYHGDPAVLGRSIAFADESATIIGVLPDDSSRGQTKLWRPLQVSAAGRTPRHYAAWARLRDGMTIQQAQRELDPLAARLEQSRPENKGLGVVIRSEHDTTTKRSRPTVNILLGAVGFILLIACVNVASLQLAKGATRETELAIRASIGAGRGRLVRQLLTENLVLSLAGSALGILLAWLLLDVLVANVPIFLSSDVPVGLNFQVLAATVTLAVVSGVLSGLVPAIRLSRGHLNAALGRGSRGVRSTLSKTAGRLFVMIEVAAAVLLVAGAALMIRSFMRLNAVDLGFRSDHFVTIEVQPVDSSSAAYASFYPAFLDRLRALPGVAAAGGTNNLPLGSSYSVTMVSTAGASGETKTGVGIQSVVPGYFEALALPLQRGRFVQESDLGAPWIILSDLAAARLFPGQPAVGQRVKLSRGDTWHDVIGVVGNVVSPRGPERDADPLVYTAWASGGSTTISGRVTGQPLIVTLRPAAGVRLSEPMLREAARSVGTPVLFRRVRNGAEWWSDTVVTPRQRTVLLGTLGGLGLLLALIGVFGVTSFTVSRRIPEIGVRLAFGARPGQVVGTMVKEASLPIGAGITIGLTGAFFLSKVIATFLFKTEPRDPLTFVAVAIVLAFGGTLAAWIPARRAAKVDPVVALRAE